MTDDIVIHLPWPPSSRAYYTYTKRGVYLSKNGRKYKEVVAKAVNEQIPALTLTYQLRITVKMFPPDRRKRDVDNHLKGLFDSLEESGLIKDDCLFDQVFIYRGVVIAKGAVIVEINKAGPLLTYPPAL
ncbi:MAG: RusA family crossover junction endodeoxyribonuclease [Thermodesulfobacteriota bacterium]